MKSFADQRRRLKPNRKHNRRSNPIRTLQERTDVHDNQLSDDDDEDEDDEGKQKKKRVMEEDDVVENGDDHETSTTNVCFVLEFISIWSFDDEPNVMVI